MFGLFNPFRMILRAGEGNGPFCLAGNRWFFDEIITELTLSRDGPDPRKAILRHLLPVMNVPMERWFHCARVANDSNAALVEYIMP